MVVVSDTVFDLFQLFDRSFEAVILPSLLLQLSEREGAGFGRLANDEDFQQVPEAFEAINDGVVISNQTSSDIADPSWLVKTA